MHLRVLLDGLSLNFVACHTAALRFISSGAPGALLPMSPLFPAAHSACRACRVNAYI